jgi:malate synthase
MSAFIPVKGDEEKNRVAFQKVREDKEREAGNGHDGTWVAHPGIVPVAKEAFDKKMPSKNQISLIPEVSIGRKELITPVTGKITEEGLRSNIRIGIRYLEAWIGGKGAVPLYNLMEDAATSEICRTQIWQWIKHKKSTENGLRIDRENVSRIIGEEVSRLNKTPELEIASELFKNVVMDSGFVEFFTIPAYEKILKMEGY